MSKRRGKLVIISAPSGAGKGTVIRELRRRRPELQYSVSATTRKPRPGEREGREYYFLTHEQFAERKLQDEFLESATYVGNSYGTPSGPILRNMENGIDTILEIEIEGARQVREKMPEAVAVFIAPPDEDELRRRLSGRGTSTPDELEERLATARIEMNAAGEFSYIVINDVVQRAVDEIIEILDKAD